MKDENQQLKNTGYFGKLPAFNDFVKFNSAYKEFYNFDSWIQDGLSVLKLKHKSDWKDIYRKSGSYTFMFRDQDSDHSIAGKMFPSFDKTGRSYPFIIFIRTANQQPDSQLLFLPILQFDEAFRRMDIVYSSASGCSSQQELTSMMEKEFTDLQLKKNGLTYKNFLEATSIQNLWETVLGNFNHPDKYFFIKKIKNGRLNNYNFLNGVKLNFPVQNELRTEIILFFIDVITKVFTSKSFAYFFNNNKDRKSLFVFGTSLNSQNYRDIMHIDDDSSKLLKLNQDSGTQLPVDSYPPSVKLLAEKSDLTLNEFINSI